MRGYKGFNKNLTCVMGNGEFKYKIGATYVEDKAKTASTGFHFVEEPLEVLRWYPNGRYCLIEASGDIDEDENKISCTTITILKELTINELYAHEVRFIMENPRRRTSGAIKDSGEAKKGEPVLVIGEEPKAKGGRGGALFMIKTNKGKPVKAAGYLIDGKSFKPGTWYDIEGEAIQ